MAMITPVGISMGAFDATKDAVFSFYSVGGNRVVANRINVYDNESGDLVYTNKEETYSFSQTVPANTLTNGHVYNFTFNTYDIDDNESLPSTAILFYCYTTPTLELTNIVNDQEISTSSYDFFVHYAQLEGELISFVTFYLYDYNNNLIKQSEDMYSSSSIADVRFDYLITGLDNNTNYYIKASGYTRNNTYIETEKVLFKVKYDYPSVFANLEVTNVCDKGYNQIVSNITKLDGHTFPKQPKYISGKKLDLLDIRNKQEVIWEDSSIVSGDFAMQIWFEVGLEGKYFKLTNAENENIYMIGKLIREIPYGETTPSDYIEITGYIDNSEKFYMRSNYVPMLNNTAYLILNFKYVPSENTYELVLNVYNQENNYVKWKDYSTIVLTEAQLLANEEDDILTFDGDNLMARVAGAPTNVVYNRLTDLQYNDNLGTVGRNKQNKFNMGDAIFPIGKVELFNGIYDQIEIYKDYDRQYSTDYTTWSYGTYMLCNFNGNISGGSLDYVTENLSSIRIKAREVGKFDYITLYDIPITTEEDLKFTRYDYRAPSGTTIEYCMVLVENGDIEGQYVSTTIDTKWRRLFVSDDTMTLSLIANVSFGNLSRHLPTGVLQPIGSKYPVVIRNSNIDYYSGSVSGTVLCEDYHRIDRKEFVKLRETWCDFLTNGKSKVIKDWNGNIFIAQISDEPTFVLNQSLSNSIGDVKFSFVEQGKWDNQVDLYKNNIVNIL